MDAILIFIGVLIFLIFSFLILYLISNLKKDRFVAADGSSFKSQSDLDVYQDLLLKTKPLFSPEYCTSDSQTIRGYDKTFLSNF